MNAMLKTLRSQRGFTLAELMIAVALVALVMAGTFVALQQGENAYQYGSGRVEVQQTARVAVDRIVKDLRTGTTVTASNATNVTFQYIDDAGATVTVTYRLNGTSFERDQTNPAVGNQVLIGGVTALALTYYDQNNVATTTPANVRSVQIRVTTRTADTTIANMANQRAVYEDRVRLRNL
jgi:prepilin-type N-terminal cleavage/methylation domain-containing protein